MKEFVENKERTVIRLSSGISRTVEDYNNVGNDNVLVIGAENTGKFESFVLPNIALGDKSYVVVDKMGLMNKHLPSCLKDYNIRTLNLIDPRHSMNYDPFKYMDINESVDAETFLEHNKSLLECIAAINPDRTISDAIDMSVLKAKEAFLAACFVYAMQNADDKNKFRYLTDHSHAFNEYCRTTGAAESCFYEHPDSLEYTLYQIFKKEADKAYDPSYGDKKDYYNSIIEDCMKRLEPLGNHAFFLRGEDEMQIEKLGDEKTCIFVVYDEGQDYHDSHLIVSMFLSQVISKLIGTGIDRNKKGKNQKSEMPVQLVLDDFECYNLNYSFANTLSDLRSFNISASIIIHDIDELIRANRQQWVTIAGNCSNVLLMNSDKASALTKQYLSERFDFTFSEWSKINDPYCVIMQEDQFPRTDIKINRS